jgi:3-deoxy-7-phosphoheptulonate synthase
MTEFITPKLAKETIRCSQEQRQCIEGWREQIVEILQGHDPRRLLIVGPCSIHHLDSAREYAARLKELSYQVEDVFLVCMRCYFEKPRTVSGWKGLLYDPFLDGSHNMQEGIIQARTFLQELTALGIPSATEFLEPLASGYISDFISWGSIGARTSQSPIHRQLAASLDMPVGFKNRTDGNCDIAIQAILAAKEAHHFLGIDDDGRVAQIAAAGNRLPHLVLRGGEGQPNYDSNSIQGAMQKLRRQGQSGGLIVDCSHDNAQKNHMQQTEIFSYLTRIVTEGNQACRGLMLESFLHAGSQGRYITKDLGASITDPCLDWQSTQETVLQGAEALRQKAPSCV